MCLLNYIKTVSESLILIVNDSFNKGIYPNKLKTAKIVALHKKGTSDNPTHYRPISLLSIFSKIIAKLMYERLSEFLEINKYKCDTLPIDDGSYGCSIFIDSKKAIDTVNHLILRNWIVTASEAFLWNGLTLNKPAF